MNGEDFYYIFSRFRMQQQSNYWGINLNKLKEPL